MINIVELIVILYNLEQKDGSVDLTELLQELIVVVNDK